MKGAFLGGGGVFALFLTLCCAYLYKISLVVVLNFVPGVIGVWMNGPLWVVTSVVSG